MLDIAALQAILQQNSPRAAYCRPQLSLTNSSCQLANRNKAVKFHKRTRCFSSILMRIFLPLFFSKLSYKAELSPLFWKGGDAFFSNGFKPGQVAAQLGKRSRIVTRQMQSRFAGNLKLFGDGVLT